ncbi:MAG: hypothetical protein SGI99_06935 [Pseudomonadota bacterium]|nr:hypothetical protein [Pseudomonadota bacterium]
MTAATFSSFIAPWRDAFPALALAELYASRDEAARLLARSVLVMEWCDAIWRASDERVTSAKLGWWAEEWERILLGQGQHPISAHLRLETVAVPLLNLLRERENIQIADWPERYTAYTRIGAEIAGAFAPERSNPSESRAPEQIQVGTQCWTALVASRHLAALWSAQSAALSSTPLDARARHQILPGNAAQESARRIAIDGAREVGVALRGALERTPALSWTQQRGARVLTVIAVRELQQLGNPKSRVDAWRNGYAAWRTALSVG